MELLDATLDLRRLLAGDQGLDQRRLMRRLLERQLLDERLLVEQFHHLVERKQLAFLGWFARRHRQGLPPLRRPWDEVPDLTLSKEFLTELGHVYGRDHVPPETRRALANGMDCAYFDQTKSKLNRAFERHPQAGAVGSKL